jgi:capsular polysaccharide biosynthesis protein
MLAATYADLATRRPVVEATVASLGLDEDWTSLVERIHADVPRRESPVVVIEALGESQTEAARLAGEVARQLVAFSPTGPEVERVAEVDAFVNSQLVQLEQRLRDLQAANERLKARLSRASGAKAGEIQSLLDANETFITNAQRNYASLLEVVAVGRVPNHVELLEEASASASPVRPGAIPLVVAGTGMGLLVGLGVRRAAARGTRRGPVSPASSPTGQDDRIAAPLAGRSAG